MAEVINDKFLDELLEALETCYGGVLNIPDTFRHAVDTVSQEMGIDFEKVDFALSILLGDGTIGFVEKRCDECGNNIAIDAHHPHCSKRFS